MSEWQPIETAPKDGTACLVTYDGIVVPARWRLSRISKNLFGWHLDNWSDLDIEFAMNPTHWMPLPEPPTS